MIRRLLYKLLPFEQYLWWLSKLYFVNFNLGFLRKHPFYKYPYYMDQLVKKGDTVIDIGANLGYYSVLFSKLVGQSGQVFSVEPVRPILQVLRKNTKKCTNVTIYPYALGSENKSIRLGNNTKIASGYVGSGSNFILDSFNTSDSEADVEFEAEMKKGSELFADLTKVDFIKCDIEGYEYVVLREIETLIQDWRPTLLVETNGEKRIQLVNYMQSLGFTAYYLPTGESALRPLGDNRTDDIVFVPQKN